jgi:hypothetical protein
MSPGLNRGTAEGEWNLCQAIIDGAALDEADAVDSTLGNNIFVVDWVVPNHTGFKSKKATGISNIAFEGTFGGGNNFTNILGEMLDDTDIPAGHPLAAANGGVGIELGTFANGDASPAGTGDVDVTSITFRPGPPLFSNPVTGVDIAVELDFTGFGVIERIDVLFAIQFAPDGLKI